MDSYGVIQLKDHLLSIPGAVTYLVAIAFSLFLLSGLTDGLPAKYWAFSYFMYGLAIILSITWIFVALGLWFYVEA
jgi:hypothetical protein